VGRIADDGVDGLAVDDHGARDGGGWLLPIATFPRSRAIFRSVHATGMA